MIRNCFNRWAYDKQTHLEAKVIIDALAYLNEHFANICKIFIHPAAHCDASDRAKEKEHNVENLILYTEQI